MSDDPKVTLELLRRRMEDLRRRGFGGSYKGPPGGGPPTYDDRDLYTRLGVLEGAVDGLRNGQNLLIGTMALVGAFVIGFEVYTLQRIDRLNDKVGALPGQVSAELRDITQTLSAAITAARQAPVPIVVIPQTAPLPSVANPPAPQPGEAPPQHAKP